MRTNYCEKKCFERIFAHKLKKSFVISLLNQLKLVDCVYLVVEDRIWKSEGRFELLIFLYYTDFFFLNTERMDN